MASADNDSVEQIISLGKELIHSLLDSKPVDAFIDCLHSSLLFLSIPASIHPTADQLALCIAATVMTLFNYFFLFGNRHVRRRRMLVDDLQKAAKLVHELEDKLLEATAADNLDDNNGKPIRIFMDGAFDMMHYGHMNAFRQGRSLGTHLVVGINSDESITQCKGKPIMNDQERLTAVEGCKFVDEVVPGCPYVMNKEYVDYVIKKYNIDYVVHGDDPCLVNGRDVYEAAKAAGKYQSIPRTEGVSTTDIVGRMLLMTTDHHKHDVTDSGQLVSGTRTNNGNGTTKILGSQSKFLTTSRMLRLFSSGVVAPTKEMNIVYVDGSWDMFHAGHIAFLKKAKDLGDYLIVGVHSDVVVNEHEGSNLPIMNLHERVLSVLGCRFCDDVLIDCPYTITPEMIASLNVSKVVIGDNSNLTDEEVRYGYPKECGIFTKITSPSDFKLGDIVERIEKNRIALNLKIAKKMKGEEELSLRIQEKYVANKKKEQEGKKTK